MNARGLPLPLPGNNGSMPETRHCRHCLLGGCPGDCLLVGGRGISPGDVVVARHPFDPALLLVKRAVRREDGGWWLASDNAAAGLDDSRSFGVLPDSCVVGRVLVRYYPWRRR